MPIRLLALDGLGAVGAYADDGDGALEGFLQVVDVVLEGLGELIGRGHLCEVGLPTGKFLVDCLPTLGVVGHLGGAHAVLLVCHACLDGGEGVEHIALHHDELGDAVYHDGILEAHDVHPTTTAVAASYGTVLMTDVANLLACLVEQFNGEGTRTHAGAVGLEDTENLADAVGSNAKTGAYTAGAGA